MICTNLKSLIPTHEYTHQFVLYVLKNFKRTNTAFLPFIGVRIESIQFGFSGELFSLLFFSSPDAQYDV